MTKNIPQGVIHQDCITGMQELDAGKVDLVFADPPFNINYKYDVYQDNRKDEDYLSFCKNWMSEVKRVLKPDGTFWLAIGDEYAAELKCMATRELGFICRSWVIWYYTFGVNCKMNFSRSHTHLFYFIKDPKKFTFNYEDPHLRVPSARQLVYGDKRANSKGRLPDNTWILRPQDIPESFLPTDDVWYVSRVAGTFAEREGWHGCQMPEQILARIIRGCSQEGEIVLDPFTGSGTTLIVSKKLNRIPIGFELSPEYAERATERLKVTKIGDALSGVENPLTSAPETSKGVTLESRQKKARPERLKSTKIKVIKQKSLFEE
jgi:site-specific DNA-methyltransferase (adenine-specific)